MIYSVAIPQGVSPGQSFQVNINGGLYMVQAPMNARPGEHIQIQTPDVPIRAPAVPVNSAGMPMNGPTGPHHDRTSQNEHQARDGGALMSPENIRVQRAEFGKQLLNTGLGGPPELVMGEGIPIPGLNGLSLPQPPRGMNDWRKPFQVSTGDDYYLDGSVKSVKFGLSWDAGCDVDGSVALFDSNQNCVDVVWYNQLESRIAHGAVVHSGDNRTGRGDGDDEVIKMKLRKLPDHVFYALCFVCVYNNEKSFTSVRSLRVRLYHGSNKPKRQGRLLCHYDVSKSKLEGKSMLVSMLVRKGAWWAVRGVGQSLGDYNKVTDIVIQEIGLLRSFMRQSPGASPKRRTVIVSVLQGRNLVAKDINGKADPFVTLKFRKIETKNEKVRRSLNPKWPNPVPLVMPRVDAAEAKKVKIYVWDWDRFTNADFMGRIKIPGAALFNLGVGAHKLWLPLGPDPKRYNGYSINGELLVQVTVQDST